MAACARHQPSLRRVRTLGPPRTPSRATGTGSMSSSVLTDISSDHGAAAVSTARNHRPSESMRSCRWKKADARCAVGPPRRDRSVRTPSPRTLAASTRRSDNRLVGGAVHLTDSSSARRSQVSTTDDGSLLLTQGASPRLPVGREVRREVDLRRARSAAPCAAPPPATRKRPQSVVLRAWSNRSRVRRRSVRAA